MIALALARALKLMEALKADRPDPTGEPLPKQVTFFNFTGYYGGLAPTRKQVERLLDRNRAQGPV